MKDNQFSEHGHQTEEIAELEIHLQSQFGNRIRHLRLVRQQDGLVLCGMTNTYHNKQLAQHAVLEATTIPLLANNIEIT